MSRRVDRARDDKGRWRLPGDRDVASVSDEIREPQSRIGDSCIPRETSILSRSRAVPLRAESSTRQSRKSRALNGGQGALRARMLFVPRAEASEPARFAAARDELQERGPFAPPSEMCPRGWRPSRCSPRRPRCSSIAIRRRRRWNRLVHAEAAVIASVTGRLVCPSAKRSWFEHDGAAGALRRRGRRLRR
jgi:hypothetical protein